MKEQEVKLVGELMAARYALGRLLRTCPTSWPGTPFDRAKADAVLALGCECKPQSSRVCLYGTKSCETDWHHREA